jgi:N-sulfoglucosamine sulfohydrolase
MIMPAILKHFLDARPEGQPFCFWYGSLEPHRAYEFEAGMKYGGKQADKIDEVPPFWPDVDSIRIDMLDYAFEIEYFDLHLQRMLQILEEKGELEKHPRYCNCR